MIAWLRARWAWLVAALGSVVLAVSLLWRRAARQRDEARRERDAQARSAERERAHSEETTRVEEAFRGRRIDVEEEARAARREVEARPKGTTRDEVIAELNRRTMSDQSDK